MSEIVISLKEPIYQGAVTEVRLREPTAADYFEIGDIVQFARSPDGSIYQIEIDGVANRYFERLVTAPSLPQARKVKLADAMAIKDALIGFFVAARRQIQSPDGGTADATNSSGSATP